MSDHDVESEHRKKRRRREIPPTPTNARLIFDETLKPEDALISETLWSSLETGSHTWNEQFEKFIAVSPVSPLTTTIEDSSWTLLAVKGTFPNPVETLPEHLAQIRISSISSAGQAFLKVFAALDQNRHSNHIPKTIDIRVVIAKPLDLDTVFVTIEKGLLEKVDEIQNKFGGGFQLIKHRRPNHDGNSLQNTLPPTERVTNLVREGLSASKIVYAGAVFPLPLPPHPITHVRPAPAIVINCEPVFQGKISADTKIVVVYAGSSQEKALKKLAPPAPIIEESLEDTAEDTSNDQFFSAAEDRNLTTASEAEDDLENDSMTEESTQEDSGDDSDSMDDMISLSAPGLPPQPAGTLSAMTAATPRPDHYRATGTHTPGSVYSNFTATTARAGVRPGKVFRTEALLRKVPLALLHPRPNSEDDDDSLVYVDTSILAKIGCFSGDWVRIEVARNVSTFGFHSTAFNTLNGDGEDEDTAFRVARIYGLSGLVNQKLRYAVDKTGERRSSFSQNHSNTLLSPALYLSPLLLANLSNAQFVKVGAMPKPLRGGPRTSHLPRPVSQRSPPLAREASLMKILTPLTQEKTMQSLLFLSLKTHFEKRRRIVKKGDILAVPIDEDLARTTASVGSSEGNTGDDQLIAKLNNQNSPNRARLEIAWFVVQSLDVELPSENESVRDEPDCWGETAIIDASQTRLGMSGSSMHQVSENIQQWSKFWLGLKTLPQLGGIIRMPLMTTADLPIFEQMPIEKRVAELAAAATSQRAVNLGLPPLVILLHSNQRQIGKTYTAVTACASVGLHTFVISSNDLLSENASTTGGGDVNTQALLEERVNRALSCGPQQTAILIQYIDLLTGERLIPAFKKIISTARVIIATTTKMDDVPDGIRSLFTHELELNAPNETAREMILRNASLSMSVPLSPNISLKNVALQTAALVAGDLLDVVNRACLARSTRLANLAEQEGCSVSDVMISGGQLTTHLLPADFSSAISAARSTFSDAIGAPKIPTVTWADVGGLATQKDAIMETISLPLTRPELFANGVRKRSGILFYGPPGTGKTLLAKAIATEFSLNFFSVKGPELLNMYIGESEANVRRVFQRARDARPCVVFFDELDSVAPKRGNQGDSGGVMDRIVSQLLAELDGMSGDKQDGEEGDGNNAGSGIFVIGATNRPDLLDPALLRPGRFDKMLYLGVADTHDSQVTILEALTRKFALAPDVNLNRVAQRLPFTYTGADLYALCSDAMLKAITRKTKAVDERVIEISRQRGQIVSTGWFFDHAATPEDIEVVVNEDDFALAQNELIGSVSAKELEHFERIRKLFEDQDVGAELSKGKTSQVGSTPVVPSVASLGNTPSLPIHMKGKGKQKELRHGKNKMIGNPDSEADSENDYVPLTGGMHYMNGTVDGHSMNGTVKGKGKAPVNDFQNDAGDNDEDLYD